MRKINKEDEFNGKPCPFIKLTVVPIENGWLVHASNGDDKTVFCDTHDSVIDYCHTFVTETLGDRRIKRNGRR